MGGLTLRDVQELATVRGDCCVSIYVPTHPAWPDSKEDRIRLDNLADRAEEAIEALGMRRPVVRTMLRPVRDLARNGSIERGGRGLAIFAERSGARHYSLPIHVDEFVTVARRFSIRPLLPLVKGDSAYFVLALAQKDVRLIRCTRDTAVELKLPPHPHDVAEATGFDAPERGFAFHGPAPVGSSGRHASTIHAIGVRADDRKEDILEYCQQVDRLVRAVLRDERAPLILAGVEFLFPVYRQANTYPHLLGEGLRGSTARLGADELRERTWPLIEAENRGVRDEALARYRQSAGMGAASDDLPTVLTAASDGLAGALFIEQGRHVWGTFDADARTVEMRDEPLPGDEDLLDTAAACTIMHRGEVFVLPREEMPDHAPAVATFRCGGAVAPPARG